MAMIAAHPMAGISIGNTDGYTCQFLGGVWTSPVIVSPSTPSFFHSDVELG